MGKGEEEGRAGGRRERRNKVSQLSPCKHRSGHGRGLESTESRMGEQPLLGEGTAWPAALWKLRGLCSQSWPGLARTVTDLRRLAAAQTKDPFAQTTSVSPIPRPPATASSPALPAPRGRQEWQPGACRDSPETSCGYSWPAAAGRRGGGLGAAAGAAGGAAVGAAGTRREGDHGWAATKGVGCTLRGHREPGLEWTEA